MQRNFSRALAAVLKHEGGFVNHPRDPGGATNKGITIATFRRYVKRSGTVAELKAISDADVAKVYRKHYWDKVRADELPGGLDYAVFDYAVNSGPGRAVKHLQEVLGVKQDGVIGPVTIAAAFQAPGPITALCDRRMRFLRSLKTWPTFGRGWSSRVLGVRTLASELAHATPTPASRPSPLPTQPEPVSPPQPQPTGKRRGIAAAIILALAAVGSLFTDFWGWLASLFG